MPTTTYSTPTVSIATIGARTDSAGAAVADLSAEEARLPAQILTEGYLKPTAAFQVVVVAGTMTARIGSGVAKGDHYVVAGDVGGQGNYIVRLDVASVDVQLDAADASQPRTDELYLVVRDNVYDTSARALSQIGYRKGDLGGANPGPDGAWKAAVLLARVVVTAGAVEAGPVTDQRASASLLTNLALVDHGALTGLGDDDHPQYLNQVRGDARYYTEAESNALLAGKASSGHTHTTFGSLTLTGSLSNSSFVKVGTTLYLESIDPAQSIRHVVGGLVLANELAVTGGELELTHEAGGGVLAVTRAGLPGITTLGTQIRGGGEPSSGYNETIVMDSADFRVRFMDGVGNSHVPVHASSFVVTSGRRLKQNIRDAESTLDAVKAVRMRRYDWADPMRSGPGRKRDKGEEGTTIGPVIPEPTRVTEKQPAPGFGPVADEMPAELRLDSESVDTTRALWFLWGAVAELAEQVAELRGKQPGRS